MRYAFSFQLFVALLLATALFFHANLFATESGAGFTSDNSTMETIVVSGTKTPKLLNDSPVAVEVIEGSTIALLTKGSLAAALDFIPGVMVTRSEKADYHIQMQGFASKHVLVLITCTPVLSPTGSAADLAHIRAPNNAQI